MSQRTLRLILMATLALGMMVGVSATHDAALAMSVESLSPPEPTLGAFKDYVPFAKEQELAMKEEQRAMLSAIESMATPRAIIFTLLAGAAMLVFITGLQIRWSLEAPSVVLARRLGIATTVAAILRTLAGAQDLVIVKRAMSASARALIAMNVPEAEGTGSMIETMVTFASIGWTIVVVALFVAVGAYFRSTTVQQLAFVEPEDE